jgi:hypothetical protein
MPIKSTLSHCLNHNIDISRVVQVTMGKDDSIEFIRSKIPLGGLNYTAGTGVKKYLGAIEAQP